MRCNRTDDRDAVAESLMVNFHAYREVHPRLRPHAIAKLAKTETARLAATFLPTATVRGGLAAGLMALRRAGVLALLLSTLPALAADKAPEKPRPRPAAQISVKVHPEKFSAGTPLAGKRLHLSTVTKTSCTAWIQADEDPLWTAGLSACRAALRARKE
jgi:hypothetical protein